MSDVITSPHIEGHLDVCTIFCTVAACRSQSDITKDSDNDAACPSVTMCLPYTSQSSPAQTALSNGCNIDTLLTNKNWEILGCKGARTCDPQNKGVSLLTAQKWYSGTLGCLDI